MRTILDTNVLITAPARSIEGDIAISTISLAELHFGVLVASGARRADRLSLLAAVERTFDALPVDEAIAASYGRLAHLVAATGRNPRSRNFDLVIAATAHAHDARLCTHNLADFAGLEAVVDVFAPTDA